MKHNKYSKEELEKFRQIIAQKRTEAEKELKRLTETIKENRTSSSESGVISVEDSAEVAERETTSALALRQRRFIENLDQALERIKKGTYGICRKTGKLIDANRLLAVPHATLSVEAKNKR